MAPRDYDSEKEKAKQFFSGILPGWTRRAQGIPVPGLADGAGPAEQVALWVALDDVAEDDPELAEAVVDNARRYGRVFSDAVYELLPLCGSAEAAPWDPLDIYLEHRLLLEQRGRAGGVPRTPQNQFLPELLRHFELFFRARPAPRLCPWSPCRESSPGPARCGRCCSWPPTAATSAGPRRTSRSRARLTPLLLCPSRECRTNRSGGRLYLRSRGSKFIKFQQLRVQEHDNRDVQLLSIQLFCKVMELVVDEGKKPLEKMVNKSL